MVDFDFQFSSNRRFKGGGIYGIVALALVLGAILVMVGGGREAAFFALSTLRSLF